MNFKMTHFLGSLSQFYPLPGYLQCLLPEASAEVALYAVQDFVGLHIDLIEEPLEPPPDTLASHVKGLVDLLAVGALEDHITGPTRLQLDPQVLRVHQLPQLLQECRIFLG